MVIPSLLIYKPVGTPEFHVSEKPTGARVRREIHDNNPDHTFEPIPRTHRSVGPDIDNSIIRLMHEAVEHLNKTNCWMCMHIPSSAEGPVVAAIPLSHLQFMTINWQNLTSKNDNNACDDPNSIASLQKYYLKAPDIPNLIENMAREHTPQGFNQTRIIGMAVISKGKGNYGDLLTVKSYHAQTDCVAGRSGTHCDCPSAGAVCNRSLSIPRVECSTVLTSSWLTPPTLRASRCTEIRCELPHFNKPASQLTKRPRHRFTITELYNVTNCINITRLNSNLKDVIHMEDSNCVGPIHNLSLDASKQISPQSVALPPGVFLGCGRKIYSYIPNGGEGICYLAYVVPMIRVVTPQEIQVLNGHHTIHKRDLQRFFGMMVPGYGVYLNQQETKALSLALETHINSTDRVITAMSTQLEEVTKVALQNRMALDFILASTGGVCEMIGTECCSYVHSANQSVENFHKENTKAIINLHKTTTWDIKSVFGSWFSDWGTSFVRNAIMFVVALLIIAIIITILFACVKACVTKLTTATVAQLVIVQTIESETNKIRATTVPAPVSKIYPIQDWSDNSSSEEDE